MSGGGFVWGLAPILIRAKYPIKKSYVPDYAFKDSISAPAKRDHESISATGQRYVPRLFGIR